MVASGTELLSTRDLALSGGGGRGRRGRRCVEYVYVCVSREGLVHAEVAQRIEF